MHRRAVGLLRPLWFSVDGIFLPVNLGYFANLLPFAVSLHNLNVIILLGGRESNAIFCLRALEREDILFLQMQ